MSRSDLWIGLDTPNLNLILSDTTKLRLILACSKASPLHFLSLSVLRLHQLSECTVTPVEKPPFIHHRELGCCL